MSQSESAGVRTGEDRWATRGYGWAFLTGHNTSLLNPYQGREVPDRPWTRTPGSSGTPQSHGHPDPDRVDGVPSRPGGESGWAEVLRNHLE